MVRSCIAAFPWHNGIARQGTGQAGAACRIRPSSLIKSFNVEMEWTKELLKMKLYGFPEGIELVLDVRVDLMAELCVLGMYTVEEMVHILARFSDPVTLRFRTSCHGFLEDMQLRLQVVTEHRLLKDLKRLLDTVSEILMDFFVLLAYMCQEVLSTVTHIPHAIALCLYESGHGFLKCIELRRQILFEIVNGNLVMGDFFKMIAHDCHAHGIRKHVRIAQKHAH
jgi:hypothetical protein